MRRQGLLTVSHNGFEFAGALQRRQGRRGGHQTAQNNRPRYADALALKVELCDAVCAERDERDAAELGQRSGLEHRLGQGLSSVAGDAVEADAAQQGAHKASVMGC